jgi:hypothetical protein
LQDFVNGARNRLPGKIYYSNVTAFENYSPTPNFIIFNTNEETNFKRIRERNFWISVEDTFEGWHIN